MSKFLYYQTIFDNTVHAQKQQTHMATGIFMETLASRYLNVLQYNLNCIKL